MNILMIVSLSICSVIYLILSFWGKINLRAIFRFYRGIYLGGHNNKNKRVISIRSLLLFLLPYFIGVFLCLGFKDWVMTVSLSNWVQVIGIMLALSSIIFGLDFSKNENRYRSSESIKELYSVLFVNLLILLLDMSLILVCDSIKPVEPKEMTSEIEITLLVLSCIHYALFFKSITLFLYSLHVSFNERFSKKNNQDSDSDSNTTQNQ